jgi:hypothetical protein
MAALKPFLINFKEDATQHALTDNDFELLLDNQLLWDVKCDGIDETTPKFIQTMTITPNAPSYVLLDSSVSVQIDVECDIPYTPTCITVIP